MPRGTDRYDEANFQGRLWTPVNDGLAAWFDALDMTTIAVDGSGKVAPWLNKANPSNNASHGTSGNRPSWTANAGAGLPGLTFVRANSQHLTMTSALATGDTTVSIAFRHTVDANFKTLFCRAVGGGAHQCRMQGSQIHQSVNFVADIQNTTAGTFAAPKTQVWSWRSSSGGGSWLVRANGVQTAASNATAITTGQNAIGVSNVADFFDGIIHEIVVSTGKATDYQIQRREGYLAWKWKTVDWLLGSHNFKNRPPLIGD